jgi:hypothetical protein
VLARIRKEPDLTVEFMFATGATHLPLLFFHGISPTLIMYYLLIRRLAPGRDTVLIAIPHTSMGLDAFEGMTSVSHALSHPRSAWIGPCGVLG